MLSNIAIQIIKILIHNDGPITNKKIAAMLELSERSVHKYMKEVTGFCKEQNIFLSSKQGVGITLDAGNQSEKILRKLQTQETPYYTLEYRIDYMINVLLHGWDIYTISLFADELYVSKNTISKDLLAVSEWLLLFDIKVQRKSGQGITIIGEEYNIRRALVEKSRRIHPTQKKEILIDVDYRLSRQEAIRLINLYGEENYSSIQSCIWHLEEEKEISFADYSYQVLFEYMIIQLYRIKQKRVLCQSVIKSRITPDNLDSYLSIIQSFFEQKDIDYNQFELEYIKVLLMSCELQKKLEDYEVSDQIRGNISIEQVTKRVLKRMWEVTGIPFYQDELLFLGVSSFLQASFVRTLYGISIQNFFLEDIKKAYPAIFSACFAVTDVYKEYIGITPNEDEIGYLSLLAGGSAVQADKIIHVAVIGAGRLTTAQIAGRKLQAHFPQIEIMGYFSTVDDLEKSGTKAELVLAIAVEIESRLPVVTITPIISERDIREIKKICSSLSVVQKVVEDDIILKELFKEELIYIDPEEKTKDKILHKICNDLEKKGYVSAEFFEDVMKREKIGTTAVGDGIAIPHGIANYVLRPAVSIVRLSQKIDWGGEMIEVIFLLALNFSQIELTKKFFKTFYDLTDDTTKVSSIKKAKSVQEIYTIVTSK